MTEKGLDAGPYFFGIIYILCLTLIFNDAIINSDKKKPHTREDITMTSNAEIANTILNQLGGGRFIVMTGSKDMIAIYNGLRMSLAKNGSKANRLEITLNAMDTYDMRFYRYTGPRYSTRGGQFKMYPEKVTTVKEYNDIYCDQLQEIFTSVTGLYTRL